MEEKKPGRPSKTDTRTKEIEMSIKNIEACIAKIAHYTGAQRILDEFNIPRWEPTKEELKKQWS